MRDAPIWAVPVIGAALVSVLGTGIATAVSRTPLAVASPTPLPSGSPSPSPSATPSVDVASLLVAPGGAYRPAGAGHAVTTGDRAAPGLATLGFRRGWTRSWRTAGGERVETFVLEFADSVGATSYARGIGSAARLLIKPVPFTVPGVPDGSGLADTVRDRDGMYAQVVAVHRGARAALLFFVDREQVPPAYVTTLARRQYEALPP